MWRLSVVLVLSLLSLGFSQIAAAQATIYVTTAAQGVTDPANCSLQEAIYSSEFKLNIAIKVTEPDAFYTTGCVAGTGNGDTIVLPVGGVFLFDHSWGSDAYNYMGPTATPIIFSKIIIQGNGSTLQWKGSENSRLFAIGNTSINAPNGTVSGYGDLTLENVYVIGFHVKGGDGGNGGAGGGLGAGGAIYVAAGSLTVENCTFSDNGAVGGNGSDGFPNGGGGGLSGHGGNAPEADVGGGGGGGGGGSTGNGGDGGDDPETASGAGGGGGGTVESGGSPASQVGGSGGYLCGGNGGDYRERWPQRKMCRWRRWRRWVHVLSRSEL